MEIDQDYFTASEKASMFLKFREQKKQEEDQEMPKKEVCESCGQEKVLSPSHGKNTCSVCTCIRSAVNQRVDVVMETVREFHTVTTLLTDEEIKSIVQAATPKVAPLKEEKTDVSLAKELQVAMDALADSRTTIAGLNNEIKDLKEKIERSVNTMNSVMKINKKTQASNDVAWFLLEGVSTGAILDMPKENIRAIRGVL